MHVSATVVVREGDGRAASESLRALFPSVESVLAAAPRTLWGKAGITFFTKIAASCFCL